MPTDTDELVAVAEGMLGQRVTWEGFLGGGGGQEEYTVMWGGGATRSGLGWGYPVRWVVWGVQSEAFHQHLSLQRSMMAHVLL